VEFEKNNMATIHRTNRIYLFGIETKGTTWFKENFVLEIKQALDAYCTDIKFSVVKLQSVYSDKEAQSDIHIDGVVYKALQFLSVDDIDELRMYLKSGLEKYFDKDIRIKRIDVVSDMFYEDPTGGY
jgi:hypothetical protein